MLRNLLVHGGIGGTCAPWEPPGGDAGHVISSYYQGLLLLSSGSGMCTLFSI